MAELDDVLQGRPTPAAWARLLQLLDPWPPSVALDAVEQALASWPVRVRAATPEAWDAVREGEPPPWWPLVRHVQLSPYDPLDSAEPLRRVTSLVFDADDEAFPVVSWLGHLLCAEVLWEDASLWRITPARTPSARW